MLAESGRWWNWNNYVAYPQPRKSLQHVLWIILPNANAAPRPLTRHDLATQRFPMERLRSDAHFPIYKEHLLAALHNRNADAKHCSKACVPELRFVTAEVAVPNGTALIVAGCSLHISMTLQRSASQWNASDQMHIFLSTKSIFWQQFTLETLTANTAAKPVSLNFVLSPLK